MAVVAFKNPNSQLREVIKTIKYHYDNPDALRRYELVLRRGLFLDSPQSDTGWHGEALHQLARLREHQGDLEAAEKFYVEALTKFGDHERLGQARVLRDYGIFLATHRDPQAGLSEIERALELHDSDYKNRKGQRQRRITESYLWRAQLLLDCEDEAARLALIDFALHGSQECFIRDQHEAIAAALPYADSAQKALLEARLIPIYARRRKLAHVATSMAKLVIDIELYLAGRAVRYAIRRE